jgi:hypothetical protein
VQQRLLVRRVRHDRLLEGPAGLRERGVAAELLLAQVVQVARRRSAEAELPQALDGRDCFREQSARQQQLLVPGEALEPVSRPAPSVVEAEIAEAAQAHRQVPAARELAARLVAQQRHERALGEERVHRRTAARRALARDRERTALELVLVGVEHDGGAQRGQGRHVVARSAAGAGAIAQRVELAPDRAFLEALERRHGGGPIPGRIHLEELRVGNDL